MTTGSSSGPATTASATAAWVAAIRSTPWPTGSRLMVTTSSTGSSAASRATALIGGSENLFFLVQWFSLIVVIVSVYDIARSLGFSSTQSLVSSIVCISFPIALLQTYSSQGDLTVAALIITSISLALSYNAQKRWVDIIGAILALSLALGTKNTAFLTLPVIGLSVIVYLIKTREFKKTLPWVGAGLLILILTTGFHFIKNIKETGYIFGVKNIMADPALSNHMLEKSEYNIPRYIYIYRIRWTTESYPKSVESNKSQHF